MFCGKLKPRKFQVIVKNNARSDCYGYAQRCVPGCAHEGILYPQSTLYRKVTCNIRRRQPLYFVHYHGSSEDLSCGQVEMGACVFLLCGLLNLKHNTLSGSYRLVVFDNMENVLKVVSALAEAKKVIDRYREDDCILSFVIGKTENIEERQKDERYKEYQLHTIAEDTPNVINSLEKALILIINVSEPYKSLHEEQIAGGGGNENANILYVAVKTQ